MLDRFAPALFVLLWSTGFLGAKYGLPYAEPMTLLTVRMALNVAVFLLMARWMSVRWPQGKDIGHSILVGVLIHGCYLGGVFFAIHKGFPAGLSALLVGLQPILTALIAGLFLGERLRGLQWLGLVLGFAGVVLVLSGRFNLDQLEDSTQIGVIATMISLVGITIGTLYQKKFCAGLNLVGTTTWQYAGAGLFYLPLALSTESMQISWTLPFILTMAWLVLGLSVVAVLLLMYLIRKGEASRVASLFYLVPPTVALETYFLFDETLNAAGLLGMGMVAFGVWMVIRKQANGTPKAAKSPAE